MKLGLTMFATDTAIDPVELAVEAEAHGFSSLWLPEHTHIPSSRATPFPGGGELPEFYIRAMDPPTVLAACIARTETLVVASGISLVAQRDPISFAKVWATLDHLSGGRTKFGVGFGWNVEEMESHGVDYATRRARTREHVLTMQALWRDEQASFHGDFIDLEPSWSWPKPVQQPRIPTYVGGGAGPKLFSHVSEYADGWLPIGGGGVRRALPQLHDAWAAAGRSGTPDVVPFAVLPNPGKLAQYEELGCSEVVFNVPAESRERVLPLLDSYAEYVT